MKTYEPTASQNAIKGVLADLVIFGLREPIRSQVLALLIAADVLKSGPVLDGLHDEQTDRLSAALVQSRNDAGDRHGH